MKKVLISALQILCATLIFLIFLEGAFYLLGFPQGGSAYLEGIVTREKLSAQKPKDEFRIFTYGESTMHGAHYVPASSPSRWLKVYLEDFLPRRNIRVINFGRMGKGSDFHYEIFRDSVAYKPDVVIFYLGHNAFLPGNWKDQVEAKHAQAKGILRDRLRHSRLFSGFYRWVIKIRRNYKSGLPEEEIIEYREIETRPAKIHRPDVILHDDPRYWQNIQFQKENIIKILDLAEKKGIHCLFFKPAGNLKDFAPTYSIHLKKLSPQELSKWKGLYQQGKKAEKRKDFSRALKFYNRAYKIDPTYAHLCFRMGKLYFAKGDLQTAKHLFQEARDYDAVIVRATSDTLSMFEELKDARNLQFIDTKKILEPESPGGILGEPIIEDNVHFSLKGHALIGRAMAEEIAQRDWIVPREEWQFHRERPYEEILKELGVSKELLFSAFLKMVSYFGSRYDNRIRFAQRALEIYPDDPRALRHLAWSYWLKGEKEKALGVYQRLADVNPEALKLVIETLPEIREAYTNFVAGKQNQLAA